MCLYDLNLLLMLKRKLCDQLCYSSLWQLRTACSSTATRTGKSCHKTLKPGWTAIFYNNGVFYMWSEQAVGKRHFDYRKASQIKFFNQWKCKIFWVFHLEKKTPNFGKKEKILYLPKENVVTTEVSLQGGSVAPFCELWEYSASDN